MCAGGSLRAQKIYWPTLQHLRCGTFEVMGCWRGKTIKQYRIARAKGSRSFAAAQHQNYVCTVVPMEALVGDHLDC